MDKKQLNVKDILINNGIVILILLMVLFVGVTNRTSSAVATLATFPST